MKLDNHQDDNQDPSEDNSDHELIRNCVTDWGEDDKKPKRRLKK